MNSDEIVNVMIFCGKDIIFRILPLRGRLLYSASQMIHEHKTICDDVLKGHMKYGSKYTLHHLFNPKMEALDARLVSESINYEPNMVDCMRSLLWHPNMIVSDNTWKILIGSNFYYELNVKIKIMSEMFILIIERILDDYNLFLRNFNKMRRIMINFLKIINPSLLSKEDIPDEEKEKIIAEAMVLEKDPLKAGLCLYPRTDQMILNFLLYNSKQTCIHYWKPHGFPVGLKMVRNLISPDLREYNRMVKSSTYREIGFYKKYVISYLNSLVLNKGYISQKNRVYFYKIMDFLPELLKVK